MKRTLALLSYLHYPLSILLLICLPFAILVRGAVFLYDNGWTGYTALLIASMCTIILLLIYLIIMDRRAKIKMSLPFRYKLVLVFAVVIIFNVSALFIFSEKNAKTVSISKEFGQVHPLLRIAVSTVAYLDGAMLVTDMSRDKKDYLKMGLSPLDRSLHYAQDDGYVHAIDLRTKGRWMIHNWSLEQLFRLLGFRTQRHMGTADHLHIALPNKKAIVQ